MVIDAKARAIEQWTADPCGPDADTAWDLLEARRAYSCWMAETIDYPASKGLDVLDVGCGQGIDLCEFALAGATVTGIDLTPRHVELARNHLGELGLAGSVLEGDAEDLPFQDRSFDRAVANGVLHHMPDIGRPLAEMLRVLRPGGRATVIVYNRQSAHYWLEQVLRCGIVRGQLLRERSMANVLSANVERSSVGARPLVRVYGRGELRRLLGKAGFTKLSISASPLRAADTALTWRLPSLDAKLAVIPAGWFLAARASRPTS